MFFVYIIESESTGILYKGFSENYLKRELEHNSNASKYTKDKGPWRLIYVEQHETKRNALIRERKLKHANKNYLFWLVNQSSNILKEK